MSKISFVYFDVGGVLVIDFTSNNERQEMLKYIGISDNRKAEFNAYFDELEVQSTRGINIDSFNPELEQKFNLTLPQDFSFKTYFAEHLVVNSSISPIIEEVKSRCKIGLLTDMYPGLLSDIKGRGLLPPIEWDIVVDSSVEKFQKPDKELYKIAELRAKVPAEEILFIDNLQINLDPALERGWQTFLYDPQNPAKSSKVLAQFLNINF